MRIALVENGTKEARKLLELLAGNDVSRFALEDASRALESSFDLIVLSGSSRFPVAYNLESLTSELTLIRNSTVPVLGICFGCELITMAFGGTLKDLGVKEHGIRTICATRDSDFLNAGSCVEVYEGHRWSIDSVPAELEVLAESTTGPEIIRHCSRPITGFQFHPEKMVNETFGDELFKSLITDSL